MARIPTDLVSDTCIAPPFSFNKNQVFLKCVYHYWKLKSSMPENESALSKIFLTNSVERVYLSPLQYLILQKQVSIRHSSEEWYSVGCSQLKRQEEGGKKGKKSPLHCFIRSLALGQSTEHKRQQQNKTNCWHTTYTLLFLAVCLSISFFLTHFFKFFLSKNSLFSFWQNLAQQSQEQSSQALLTYALIIAIFCTRASAKMFLHSSW